MKKRKNKKRRVKVNKNQANLMTNKRRILKYRINKYLRMSQSLKIRLKIKRKLINKQSKNL